MMNAKMIKNVVMVTLKIAAPLGCGILCGATVYPAFKKTLGVKPVGTITVPKDIPLEEVKPDDVLDDDFEDVDLNED